jgi:raffinose/stachyose/melibiose transport system permease protein
MITPTIDRPRARPPIRRPRSALTTSFVWSLRYAFAVAVALVVLVPVIYAVLGGFRTTGQIAAHPVDLPQPWVFDNYSEILRSDTVWQQVGNSVLIAAVTLAVVLPCSSFAAFVLARFEFAGREAVYMFFAIGLLFPVAVAVLPLFITLRSVDLTNNPLGVALPQAAFELPVAIIVLRPFFRAIPAELEEAAVIDGCGPLRFFLRIALPMSRPVLATIAVLALVHSWNALLLPLIVLSEPDLWTLPQGATNFSTQYSSDTARVLAFTSLSMIPALLFYVIVERQIVRGLASGAVKG